jgi:hypothetical protein
MQLIRMGGQPRKVGDRLHVVAPRRGEGEKLSQGHVDGLPSPTGPVNVVDVLG